MTTPLRKLMEQVGEWNAAHPIGTPVHVRMDTRCIDTTTRSEASVLGGHSTVIWLEGVSGAYSLDRVTARPRIEDQPPGRFYRHYKGGIYEKLHDAKDSETGEEMVVYQCSQTADGGVADPPTVWVRPKAMFHEVMPDGRRRFEREA